MATQKDRIPLLLTQHQIKLIKEHCLVLDPAVTKAFDSAKRSGINKRLLITYAELDELAGGVAAAANHAGNRGLEDELDEIYEYLDEVQNDSVE